MNPGMLASSLNWGAGQVRNSSLFSLALLFIGLFLGTLEEGVQICSYLLTLPINLDAALEVSAFFDRELAGDQVTHDGGAFRNLNSVAGADIPIHFAGNRCFTSNDVGIQVRSRAHCEAKASYGD